MNVAGLCNVRDERGRLALAEPSHCRESLHEDARHLSGPEVTGSEDKGADTESLKRSPFQFVVTDVLVDREKQPGTVSDHW